MVFTQMTQYGFRFGTLDVERVHSDDARHLAVIEVRTKKGAGIKHNVQIVGYKSGAIQVMIDGVIVHAATPRKGKRVKA